MAEVSNLQDALRIQREIFNRDFSRGPFTGVVQNLAYQQRVQFSRRFLKNNSTILDIGCGDGTVTKAVASALARAVVAIDVSEQAISVAKEVNGSPKVTYLVSTIEDYNPGHQFDGILMFEILEHIFEPEQALRKINSLLHNDGVLVLSTPNYKRLTNRIKTGFGIRHIRRRQGKNKKRIGCDHFQEFDYVQLRQLLEKTGFAVIAKEGIILWTDTVGGKAMKDVWVLQKLNFFLGSLFPSLAGHMYIAARKRA